MDASEYKGRAQLPPGYHFSLGVFCAAVDGRDAGGARVPRIVGKGCHVNRLPLGEFIAVLDKIGFIAAPVQQVRLDGPGCDG